MSLDKLKARCSVITNPFAENGDRVEIPATDSTGKVNYNEGFTDRYELNPEAEDTIGKKGEYIPRGVINEAFFVSHKSIQDLQYYGFPVWNEKIANTSGYPLLAKVTIYYNMLTNTLTTDPSTVKTEEQLFLTELVVESKIANNKTKPTELINLYSSWMVRDGARFGDIRIIAPNITSEKTFAASPGWLLLGDGDVTTKYYLEDFTRVKYMLKKHQTFFPFEYKTETDNGKEYFTFTDVRGLFPRVYSNNHPGKDTGRAYHTIQDDATLPINGEFSLIMAGKFYDSGSTLYQKLGTVQCAAVTDLESNAFYVKQEQTECDKNSAYHKNKGYSFHWDVDDGDGIDDKLGKVMGNKIGINTSKCLPTAKEIRPMNFNIRMQIKV